MVNLNRGYRTITKRPFDLQQFNSDRDEALLSLDKEKIQTFQKSTTSDSNLQANVCSGRLSIKQFWFSMLQQKSRKCGPENG